MIKKRSELLSVCGDYVRKSDPDHFFCALFMPVSLREQYFRLLAFYAEITRAVTFSSSWMVSGPMAGYIRLQWWRDLLMGQKDRSHEIAPFIQDSLKEGLFRTDELMQILEAREEELEGIRDWAHWRSVMQRSAGQVYGILARLFEVESQAGIDAVMAIGVACEITHIARALPMLLQAGRYPLPQGLMGEYGLQRSEDGIAITPIVLDAIRKRLKNEALDYFRAGAQVNMLLRYGQISLVLPAIFARRDLNACQQWDRFSGQRGVQDKLAVVIARLLGRINLDLA